MKKNLTITSFYKKYEKELPYSLPLFRKAVIKNLDKLKGIVLVIHNKRNTYKVMNENKLIELIKKGEIV